MIQTDRFPHKINLTITRYGEDTAALLSAWFSRDEEYFKEDLTNALTRWAEETPEGKNAWRQSCQDFNIGDLSCCQDDPTLKPYLTAAGISDLSVDTVPKVAQDWSFDSILMNMPEEEDDESEGDDLCDTCMRSGVEVSRTELGKTVCVECNEDYDSQQ